MSTPTPLAQRLADQVARTGPISVSDYMAACLLDPQNGYYTTQTPFGTAGDFVTAPEISQMFGELVGLALAQAWIDRGRPAPFCLAELGPGRGTLMADLWRATAAVPGFHAAARLTLVEASPSLRAAQADRLSDAAPAWCTNVAELPALPLFLVANEFFDALPIRQFQRGATHWHERQVGVAQNGALQWGLAPEAPFAPLDDRLAGTAAGAIVEYCPAARPIMTDLAGRIVAHGGAAILIDYGGWGSLGDTLQAVRDHRPIDPLAAPGCDDVTAHVDFAPLAQAARAAGAAVSPLVPQGVFLERLGITARAERLAAALTGDALATHVAAHRRLTHPDEMGTLFQSLGVTDEGSAPLPGLQPWP